jgi:hypothetical protein
MKIMLTSFGLGREKLAAASGTMPIFEHMPPLEMRTSPHRFDPQYSLLILCDKLVLDVLSYQLLMDSPSPMYANTAKAVRLLSDEGFVELLDYSSILDGNIPLLKRMTESDLVSAGRWRKALNISQRTWRDYVDRTYPSIQALFPGLNLGTLPYQRGYADAGQDEITLAGHLLDTHSAVGFRTGLPSRIGIDSTSSPLRDFLRPYLTYINSNLILSNETESALHDWDDFQPFYQQKFLGVGQSGPPATAQADASHQLFDMALPELSIESPEHLIRILKHRHIEDLRALIDAASKGDVAFDVDFARRALREVFEAERKVGKQRRVIGYLTLPIGFIPLVGNFAQALVQEAAGTLLERRLKKPYRWLYMLSDVAAKSRSAPGHK